MIRIILFLITNLAVTSTFALILALTGINSDSIYGILIISSLFGFSGSLVSLLISKWIALRSVNGRIIKFPTNEKEKWLTETIQKQATKKRIKTPQIAIYDSIDINAFATGPRRNSALVAVSSGLLEKMTENEAEAVIGHEISHISNGDMITMSLIQGVVNTFVIFISRIVSQILNSVLSSNNENDGNEKNPFVFFIISTILEITFGMLASIITMWFSRHREFYADASSAKLVGREKMIAALSKLKSSYEPQESDSIITLCINGKSKSSVELFASHPSLDKRIQALNNKKYM